MYLVADAPPLLVALRRASAGLWVLDQIAGPKNAAPPPGTKKRLVGDLAALGIRIVVVEPAEALARLDAEARRRRSSARHVDVEDADGDAGEELVA